MGFGFTAVRDIEVTVPAFEVQISNLLFRYDISSLKVDSSNI